MYMCCSPCYRRKPPERRDDGNNNIKYQYDRRFVATGTRSNCCVVLYQEY